MGNSTSSFSEAQHTFPDAELLHVGGTTCECYRVKLYGKLHFLKRLKPELRTNPQYVAALQKEFELGYQLEHPHIVRYVSKTADGILMDYVDGETLDKFIEHHPDFFKKKENADRIVLQLLDAVGYLHQQQIIHLDLKPSNILVTYNGNNVKIIDFGLSLEDCQSEFKIPGGTKSYAAPELLEGKTLKEQVESSGRLVPAQMQQVMQPICHALIKIHSFGVLHLDVSPDNIMLTSEGARLLDFGGASIPGRDRPGAISYKRGYSPPEQFGDIAVFTRE